MHTELVVAVESHCTSSDCAAETKCSGCRMLPHVATIIANTFDGPATGGTDVAYTLSRLGWRRRRYRDGELQAGGEVHIRLQLGLGCDLQHRLVETILLWPV